MKFSCPKCGVTFGGFAGLPTSVACPTCGTTFQPEDSRSVESRSQEAVAEVIRGFFAGVTDSVGRRACDLLTHDPPLPGRGGYRGLEQPIRDLIDEAVSQGEPQLLDSMLRAFAEAQDWYLCHYLWERYDPSPDAKMFLSGKAMSAPHLGGQSGDYFHLLAILCKGDASIRRWCERIRTEHGPTSILGENMSLVLQGRA